MQTGLTSLNVRVFVFAGKKERGGYPLGDIRIATVKETA